MYIELWQCEMERKENELTMHADEEEDLRIYIYDSTCLFVAVDPTHVSTACWSVPTSALLPYMNEIRWTGRN